MKSMGFISDTNNIYNRIIFFASRRLIKFIPETFNCERMVSNFSFGSLAIFYRHNRQLFFSVPNERDESLRDIEHSREKEEVCETHRSSPVTNCYNPSRQRCT